MGELSRSGPPDQFWSQLQRLGRPARSLTLERPSSCSIMLTTFSSSASGRSDVAIERLLDQPAEDLVRVEILLGDGTSGLSMPRIVRYDLMDCGNRFLHRRKWQQPFPDRKDGRETGILDNDGPASGQVAGGALTEPARLTLNIAVLG